MPLNSEPSLLVDMLAPIEIGKGNPPADPASADYQWHLLAEGDSWFSIGGIPSSNLLSDLRLPRWTQVFSVATPGDTIKRMSDIARNPDLSKYVAKKNFNYPFEGMLLSAGGNDHIDEAHKLIRAKPAKGQDPGNPASYVNADAVTALLEDIVSQVGKVHALWNSKNSLSAGRPIFMHTYDYVTPRNAPAMFFGAKKLAGPWIYPVLSHSGLPVDLQQRITDLLFDALAETLLSLDAASGSSRALDNVHVVDTRHTLVRANPTESGNSNDWLNEIHPNAGGYRKISARLAARVAQVLA